MNDIETSLQELVREFDENVFQQLELISTNQNLFFEHKIEDNR